MDYGAIAVGDYLEVQIENKQGDHNLDGTILSGMVVRKYAPHRFVQLHTGWCCHEKDRTFLHIPEEGFRVSNERPEMMRVGRLMLLHDAVREIQRVKESDALHPGESLSRALGLLDALVVLLERVDGEPCS